MSDFLSLDWERRRVSGLDAEVARGKVRVRRCFGLAWPDEIHRADDPQAAGRWLREELDKLDVRSRQVLVCLPREEVVVRQLDLPDVPDDELPDLVRLQAETKSTSSLDQLVLDFLPLPRAAGKPLRQVLMVTIVRERIDRIRQIVEAAGCELAAAGISPVACAELAARVERRQNADPAATSLIVARHETRVEISLMQSQRLMFTHSTQLAGDDEEHNSRLALAEIRRSLGSLSRLDADVSVARAWVIGSPGETQTLGRLLSDHLECEVGTIDPLSDAAAVFDSTDDSIQHAPYAGPLGMLLAQDDAIVAAVDFVSPREQVVPTDRRRLQAAVAAAAVVLTFVAGYAITQWRVAALNAEIEARQQDLARLEEAMKNGRPTLDAAAAITDWDRRAVDWLGQMAKLNDILPVTGRIYLVGCRFGPSATTGAGQIQADGFARSRQDVEQLYQRLAESGYRVQPHEISRTSNDAEYAYRFQLDAVLVSSGR